MKSSTMFFASLVLVIASGASANPFVSSLLYQSTSATPALIGPPPTPGSEIDVADFRELHYWQANRTKAQCANANKEVNLFLRTFIGARTDLLSPLEEIKLTKDISMLQLKLLGIVSEMKNRYNRPRPYNVDSKLKPCLPAENASSAYPSGHAASAYAIAEALANLFPRRTDLLLERAQEVAFNRLLGGVHHRTDLTAGEKVGRYYGRKMRNFSSY